MFENPHIFFLEPNMYTHEIIFTTLSLFMYSFLLVSTTETRVAGRSLVFTSLLAIFASFADLNARNEPIKQRAVYQLMHLCFLACGVLHINFRKQSLIMLGLVLLSCSILLDCQVSNYIRILIFKTGMVALITKDDKETAYSLAVSALAFTQDKSNSELGYALILLIIYPLMMIVDFVCHRKVWESARLNATELT
jgi:hypothetical protein